MNNEIDKMADVATSQRTPGGYKEAMVKRDKTWDECGIEEKVERIRQQLRMHRDMSQYVARTASEAKEIAVSHQHNHTTGEVLRPIQRHGGAEQAGSSSYDPLR